jgi:hypothetical protein
MCIPNWALAVFVLLEWPCEDKVGVNMMGRVRDEAWRCLVRELVPRVSVELSQGCSSLSPPKAQSETLE